VIILFQGTTKNRYKKLVSPLLYTTGDCRRNNEAWIHFAPSQQPKG